MEYYKLNDILLEMHSGGTPSTEKKEYWNGTIKWLSSGETSQNFIYDTIDKITEEGVKNSSTKLANKNDVVMACAGQGKTRGQVSYLLDDMYINQSVIALKANPKKVNSLYLYYNLSSRYDELRGGSDFSSTRGSITTATLKKLNIQLPPLPTQQKIAGILSKYDEAIENNNKRIKLLEQMAQNLYKEWFVRFRFPGWQRAEFENGIPKGWKYRKIGECGEIIGGGTPSTEIEEYWGGNIPWLTPADLSIFEYVYIKEGANNITDLGLRKSSAKLMPKNTVLLSSRAPVGYVAIAQNEISTNQGFKSVICNDKVLNYAYLFYFFKLNTIALQNFATGATFPELSGSMLKRIKILLPEIKLQNKFCTMVTPLFEEINILAEKIQNLSRQRDLLLPRLMSGKLQVFRK